MADILENTISESRKSSYSHIDISQVECSDPKTSSEVIDEDTEKPRLQGIPDYIWPSSRSKITLIPDSDKGDASSARIGFLSNSLARSCTLAWFALLSFDYMQEDAERCYNCCIPWKTTIEDVQKNLNSRTLNSLVLLLGGAHSWVTARKDATIYKKQVELLSIGLALWIFSRSLAGTSFIHFFQVVIVGGACVYTACGVVCARELLFFDRLADRLGVWSTRFRESEDETSNKDNSKDVGNAICKVLIMPLLGRHILLLGLKLCYGTFSFSVWGLVTDLLILLVTIGVVFVGIELVRSHVLQVKLDVEKQTSAPLRTQISWSCYAPKVRWVVTASTLVTVHDLIARILAAIFITLVWMHASEYSLQDLINMDSETAQISVFMLGGALAWSSSVVKDFSVNSDVAVAARNLLNCVVAFMKIYVFVQWIMLELGTADFSLKDLLDVRKASPAVVGFFVTGSFVSKVWRKLHEGFRDGLVYNFSQWIGLRYATEKSDSMAVETTMIVNPFSELELGVTRFVWNPALLAVFLNLVLEPVLPNTSSRVTTWTLLQQGLYFCAIVVLMRFAHKIFTSVLAMIPYDGPFKTLRNVQSDTEKFCEPFVESHCSQLQARYGD
ncbi:hypothetical protein Mapa_004090 [Marchantia paleacea]|nr:hypothetical protein Mapa_004090 [Marchantia paleacea]